MVKHLYASLIGLMTATAWTLWGYAVSHSMAVTAAVADLMLLGLGAQSVNYLVDHRYSEFVAYALAAAVGTYVTVKCGG